MRMSRLICGDDDDDNDDEESNDGTEGRPHLRTHDSGKSEFFPIRSSCTFFSFFIPSSSSSGISIA